MEFAETLNSVMGSINDILWHEYVLFTVVGVGVLFTIWSKFSQWTALTHGVAVVRGVYDKKGDPGAINHFQALSAALSATVGLGNIGGVAIAIALGGPGSVVYLWLIGLVGMALKSTEVIQSMLYRNTDDPDNPHGGPMWVAEKGLKEINPALAPFGWFIGAIFCVTLLISTVTGGNMFQAWNVGRLTSNFGVPDIAVGIILAVLVGAVIIGGIKRIGNVAGKLVPMMLAIYILAALYVLFVNITEIPSLFALIVKSAFSPTEAGGAFLGGTVGVAFMWGMKRALFSNEAGQGSAPIAHSAARTSEPVREGVVAGLEPFIDTILVCTLTALVILATGAWNRGPEASFETPPEVAQTEDGWVASTTELPAKKAVNKKVSGEWREGDEVFVVANSAEGLKRLTGKVVSLVETLDGQEVETLAIEWEPLIGVTDVSIEDPGLYGDYVAAELTAYAFDRAVPGLGLILVTLASWLFAISTMISWSYYGEQGIIYLVGDRGVLPYKVIYCLLIVVACSGLITTTTELDNLTGLGTGVMLFANIPIMLIFGKKAMKAYHEYKGKLDRGEFKAHAGRELTDLVDGD